MGLKEEVIEMRKEVEKAKEENKNQSLAMELLKDSKKANIRICKSFTTIIIAILILWSITIVYLIHTLNDISSEEITTSENYNVKQDSGDNSNNNFINGGNNEVNN